MRHFRTIFSVLLAVQFVLAPLVSGASAAVISGKDDVALTVYNQDFAVVREARKVKLKKGLNWVELDEVAALIDPTSVYIKSLSYPDSVRIVEQNYEFDLVNYGKLLQKYIGKEIEIHKIADIKTNKKHIIKARLISSGYSYMPQSMGYGMRPVYRYSPMGQPLFEIDGKIHTAPGGTIVLPALPEGLISKPTLSWQLETKKAGTHTIELSYMTSGVKWVADYVALINKENTKLDLTGWVTLDNRSGVTYKDAKLKLVAGDVNVAGPEEEMMMERSFKSDYSAAPQFTEKSFFEYHLYTLQRKTTLKNSEIKQVEFNSAQGVKITKRYLYDGYMRTQQYRHGNLDYNRTQPGFMTASQNKVWVMIDFKNSAKNNLGIPLPKGRIRLYMQDEDGAKEFVGEDTIDHTPKDETVGIYAGNAFDIVGERKQTDFKLDNSRRSAEETFEITLRNHKETDVVVTVREHLYRGFQWKITGATDPFEKKDSQTAEFKIKIPADGTSKVAYTVNYTW